jgi:hypothetical protein
MTIEVMLEQLTELQESVHVNRAAVARILGNKAMGDGDKRELIKSLTIPLIINNKAILEEMENFYTKA